MTQSAKLGTLVTGVIYRYPGILVKTVTALKPSLVALHREAQERLRVLHRAVGLHEDTSRSQRHPLARHARERRVAGGARRYGLGWPVLALCRPPLPHQQAVLHPVFVLSPLPVVLATGALANHPDLLHYPA